MTLRQRRNAALRKGSEPRGRNPKALSPLTAGGNALQLLVNSGVRQVEGVGNRRHRLKTDEVARRGRKHHRYRVLWPVCDRDPLFLTLHPELSAPVRAADQVAEHVVKLHAAEGKRVGKLHRLALA